MLASMLLIAAQSHGLPLEVQAQLVRSGASIRVEASEVSIDFLQKVRDADLAPLAGLENVVALRIMDGGVTNDGMRHLKRMPRLWLLVIKSERISDGGVDTLTRQLPGLKKLDLMEASLTRRGIGHLKRLTKLEELYLHGATLQRDTVGSLSQLRTLKLLTLPLESPAEEVARLKFLLPKARIRQF